MRSHKYLLFISFILLIIEIVLFIFILNKGYFKNGYYILFCILIMIWVVFYPIGFYTSYRHIGNADSKGNIISTITFNDNVVISFFLIPLLLSPFLIFDFAKGNYDIYITCSNSHLLSSELSTLLSGRYEEIIISLLYSID